MNPLRLIALQLDLRWQQPLANQKHIEELLENESQTDIIVLPEMFTTGFTMDAVANAEGMQGQTLAWMQAFARKKDALLMGSLIIAEDGEHFNRLIAMSPSGIVAQYDKRHCFRMAGEHKHFRAGEERVIFEWKDWRICPQICYDLRFPVWSRTQSSAAGPDYDLLVYVANWPEKRIAHWEALLRARAIENQAFTVGLNRVGKDENNIIYSGNSMILDPLGKELDFCTQQEKILSATLDLKPLQDYRQKFPAWQDADEIKN